MAKEYEDKMPAGITAKAMGKAPDKLAAQRTPAADGAASDPHSWVVQWVLKCRQEAKIAKWNRVMQTRENWDVYWLRQDMSHKLPGQSREILSMQAMAVESTAAFFQQSLSEMGEEWWSVDAKNAQNEDYLKIDSATIKGITQNQLLKANFLKHVTTNIKSGLLGGTMISKIHGDYYEPPRYVATKKKNSEKREAELEKEITKCWKARIDLVSIFNYYPDPTPTVNGKRLYEIEDMWMDYSDLCALSYGPNAIYDEEVVKLVEHHMDDDAEEKFDEMRRTNQNQTSHSFRGRVKVTEYWGNLINEDGEVVHENVVCTLANDKWLIRPPTKNPLWHQESPYVTAGLLDIPDAVWPKALMDSPTKHNIAATEVYNMMVDGAMRAVNNIGMLRQDWLQDPNQVQGGIKPGTYLGVNGQCPPGAKVLEMTQSGDLPPETVQMFNIIQQEFNRDALTSDIRQGMQPKDQVSATQVVEANQTITSVFQGLTKNVEQSWIQKVLEKLWMTCCQYSDLMDEDEIRSVLSPERAVKFLAMSPQERFANTANGTKFRVNGITLTLQKQQDSRKYLQLLQLISQSPTLEEAFVKKYSMDNLLKQILRGMGLDVTALEIPIAEQEMMQDQQQPAPQPGGNQMSQQPTAMGTMSPAEGAGSAAPPQLNHAGFAKGPR